MKLFQQIAFLTPRGHVLLLCGMPVRPTLTVELASKWYGIVLVKPINATMLDVEELSFEVLEEHRGDGSYFCDHCPNPHAVRRYCEANDVELDEFAEEMIIGRWEQEARTKGEYVR